MSAEFWAIIGVGVALAGLQWRTYASLSAGLNGRMDRMEARLDRIEADLTSVKERLSRLEGQVELLLRGLHIEISGGEA